MKATASAIHRAAQAGDFGRTALNTSLAEIAAAVIKDCAGRKKGFNRAKFIADCGLAEDSEAVPLAPIQAVARA
jgi:hypothetical protein